VGRQTSSVSALAVALLKQRLQARLHPEPGPLQVFERPREVLDQPLLIAAVQHAQCADNVQLAVEGLPPPLLIINDQIVGPESLSQGDRLTLTRIKIG
jgi:hypothetical protein